MQIFFRFCLKNVYNTLIFKRKLLILQLPELKFFLKKIARILLFYKILLLSQKNYCYDR